MSDPHHLHRRHGRNLVLSIAFLLIGSIVVLWAWNTLAVDLFGQPEMKFRHGFAFMMTIFVVALAGAAVRHIFDRKPVK